MSEINLNISDIDFAHDDETREARHELLASLLGGYLDNELPPETRSHIDAHLTGCARCRRELDVHRSVRDRLGKESVPAASSALRDRIASGIRNAPPPTLSLPVDVPEMSATRRRVSVRTWAGVGVIAFVGVLALTSLSLWRAPQVAQAPATVVTAQSVPLFNEILADYRRVTAGNLPGRARDLDAVRAAVPFSFAPITSNSLRLFGAWTTSIASEPAVVLYYRWNDRILLQYFVTDQLLFQSPGVRASLARQGSVSVTDHGDGMLVWTGPEYGTLLVGDFSNEQLAALRAASIRDAAIRDAITRDTARNR